jgi:hypothetical protein
MFITQPPPISVTMFIVRCLFKTWIKSIYYLFGFIRQTNLSEMLFFLDHDYALNQLSRKTFSTTMQFRMFQESFLLIITQILLVESSSFFNFKLKN